MLMGDAAHAITPNTGQGGSMALQDAQMLATLLSESLRRFGGDGKKAIDTTISGLYDLRHEKLAEIQRKAIDTKGSGSKPSTIQAALLYLILWIILNVKPIGKPPYEEVVERSNDGCQGNCSMVACPAFSTRT